TTPPRRPASAATKAYTHPIPATRRAVVLCCTGGLPCLRLGDLPPPPLDHRRRLRGGPHCQPCAPSGVGAPRALPGGGERPGRARSSAGGSRRGDVPR